MTVTPIIARPGESIKGEAPTVSCGCVVENGRAVERCPEATALWTALIEARDATKADGRKRAGKSRIGRKARTDAFVAARDEYHRHIRGAA